MCAMTTTWWERNGQKVVHLVPFVACEAAIFVQPPSLLAGGLERISERAILMGLAGLPFVLSAILAWRIGVACGRAGLRLHTHRGNGTPPLVAEAVQKIWSYERDRYRRSVSRTEFYAFSLGSIATLMLTCAVLLIHWPERLGIVAAAQRSQVATLAASVFAATATSFLVDFVKVTVRLSSYDISARAFAWSMRSLVLVVIADVGLLVALTNLEDLPKALLIGIAAGVMGGQAINVFLEKANEILGIKRAVPKGPSPLLAIDGILPEHADRLEEEGISSLQDLAHAPTARLFFNTPYGLQTVCDWQDQALLLVHLGADRATGLFRQMGILGAAALRKLAADLLLAPASEAQPTRDALRRALGFDKETPLEPMLLALRDDECMLRLELHCRSIAMEPAHFDDPVEQPQHGEDDLCVQESPGSLPAPQPAHA
jgi:hypothetical protein